MSKDEPGITNIRHIRNCKELIDLSEITFLRYAAKARPTSRASATAPRESQAPLGLAALPSLAWGQETFLPAGVPCTLEGPHQGLTIAEWRRLGVDVAGRPRELRYLVMPAGRLGPAFLVSDNFYVLKAYNESDVYALYVGHLADRIAGRSAPFTAGWQPIGAITHAEIQAMQLRLEAAGHDVGGADGLIGFRTRIAVGAVQTAVGLPQTCFPDRAFIQALG